MLPLPPQPKGKLAPLRFAKKIFYSIPPRQVGFCGLEFFYWAAQSGSSMMAMYLQNRGLSAGEVGQLSSFLAFIGIFAPPIWGMVSDKLRSVKKVLMLCMAASALFWLASPAVFHATSLALAWVMFPLFRFFNGPTNALLDSWIVRAAHADRRMSYGSIRMFGSLGFAIVSIAYTALIRNFSDEVMFVGYAAAVVPMLLIAVFMKDDHQSKRSLSLGEMRAGIRQLMRSFPYVTFLLFNIALYMPVNASFTFLPYLIESIGGDTSMVAAILGIKALMEIPLLLLSGRLIKRFKLSWLLVTAACFYALEMFLYPLCGDILSILVVQCIHGVVFGLYISAQIQYVHSLAPADLTATAVTLSGAATALAGIVGNSLGGIMIDTAGIRPFYILSGCVQAAAVLLFVLSLRHTAKKEKRAQAAPSGENEA